VHKVILARVYVHVYMNDFGVIVCVSFASRTMTKLSFNADAY